MRKSRWWRRPATRPPDLRFSYISLLLVLLPFFLSIRRVRPVGLRGSTAGVVSEVGLVGEAGGCHERNPKFT
jgi:hypothetical protein